MPAGLAAANGALQAVGVDVEIAAALAGVDLVHSHTWYANTAGLLASLVHGVPHVVTAHSLEPRRPWKADQLGGGYRLSSWAERTAYLGGRRGDRGQPRHARSTSSTPTPSSTRPGCTWSATASTPRPTGPIADPDVVRVARASTPTGPYALFVGRITRQKGVDAPARRRRAAAGGRRQLVLCAGAADTPGRAAAGRRRGGRAAGAPRAASSGSRRCCRASSSSR